MDNILLHGETIDSMLRHADEIARSNNIDLSFQSDSIKDVDWLLNLIHKEYISEEEHNEESLSGICLSLGIYIGEVIRRTINNEEIFWYYGKPKVGGPEVPYLRYRDNELYPTDWVAKQIQIGKKESVYKKYEFYVAKLASLID